MPLHRASHRLRRERGLTVEVLELDRSGDGSRVREQADHQYGHREDELESRHARFGTSRRCGPGSDDTSTVDPSPGIPFPHCSPCCCSFRSLANWDRRTVPGSGKGSRRIPRKAHVRKRLPERRRRRTRARSRIARDLEESRPGAEAPGRPVVQSEGRGERGVGTLRPEVSGCESRVGNPGGGPGRGVRRREIQPPQRGSTELDVSGTQAEASIPSRRESSSVQSGPKTRGGCTNDQRTILGMGASQSRPFLPKKHGVPPAVSKSGSSDLRILNACFLAPGAFTRFRPPNEGVRNCKYLTGLCNRREARSRGGSRKKRAPPPTTGSGAHGRPPIVRRPFTGDGGRMRRAASDASGPTPSRAADPRSGRPSRLRRSRWRRALRRRRA